MLTRHEHTELSQLEFNICVLRERTHTNVFCPIYMTVFVVVAVYVEKLLGLKLFTF